MYIRWIKRVGLRMCLPFLLTGCVPLLLRIVWMFLLPYNTILTDLLWYGSDAIYIIFLLHIGMCNKRQPVKKPFVVTARVKRLIISFFMLSALFHINLLLPYNLTSWGSIWGMNMLRYSPGLLLPFFVLLGHILTLPFENSIKRWYYNNAAKKLSTRDNLVRIGVVGSYGKTSTKFILGTILQEKRNTLVTPSSINTPMGIARVIREQLTAEHELFVAEMGERYKGDITELCDLVKPHYGIITAIGKQHLDTFGSYEVVIDTISELLHALPQNGAVFINGDNSDCRRIYNACTLENKFLYGLEGEDLFIKAVDIKVGISGSTFTLITREGEQICCQTALLGKHNVGNITGAAAIAKYLGVPMKQISVGIEKIKPIEHRLQLIQGAVTVIDDSYNANPAGTKAALDVLKEFAPARRIIVTPGMVELGIEEEVLNEAFGHDIAVSTDIAILVGTDRVEPIRKGLLAAGFSECNIVQVNTLEKAVKNLPHYAIPGSVVLFANDLPDNYTKP